MLCGLTCTALKISAFNKPLNVVRNSLTLDCSKHESLGYGNIRFISTNDRETKNLSSTVNAAELLEPLTHCECFNPLLIFELEDDMNACDLQISGS